MKKILVVESNKGYAEHIADVLILNGYGVYIVTNADKQEQSLSSYRPDLIISTILMPGMVGVECLELIRNDGRYFNLPFILLWEKEREKNTFAGKDSPGICLEKAFDCDELVLSVSRLLDS
jgi:adenylate cyclase